MKRLGFALSAATLMLSLVAGPAAAAAFPEQGRPHSCAVVTSLPKDIIGHLTSVAPGAAARLEALLIDACFGG
ncbi:MAG: hypothetical protein ACJ761_10240 [Chloroflexota bacterium]